MSDTLSAPGSRKALKKVYAPTTLAMRAVYGVEYALFWSVMSLFRVLGLRRASDLGGWLARTLGPTAVTSAALTAAAIGAPASRAARTAARFFC